MGKKRYRKNYTSKGLRRSVSRSTISLMRQDSDPFAKQFNILSAWRAGKNPWVTIANPDRNQTNKRFIKVRANGYYGNPKEATANLFKSSPAS